MTLIWFFVCRLSVSIRFSSYQRRIEFSLIGIDLIFSCIGTHRVLVYRLSVIGIDLIFFCRLSVPIRFFVCRYRNELEYRSISITVNSTHAERTLPADR